MNGNPPPNGKVTLWLLGFIIPPLIGVTIGWITHIATKVQAHGEHIAVMQAQMSDTRDELHRINNKLDKILETHK
jgi:hypothetical protein